MNFIIQARLVFSCIAVSMISVAYADTATPQTFEVRMTVQKSCSVTTGSGANIDLGSVAASATNTTQSGTISVNCSKTTPYNIGLSPSNTNTLGLGEMTAVGAVNNTDKIPYQLTSDDKTTIWGNTATANDAGNGRAGTGTGANQTYTVYATAASANFTPGNYRDTVTVNVNY